MAIDGSLASLSETLWTAATGTYMLAVVAYTGEYAFGKNGRIAQTSTAQAHAVQASVRQPALVGGDDPGPVDATSHEASDRPRYGAGSVESGAGRRWGRAAVGLTVLAALVHAGSVALRGIAVDRVPWGNMYEFTLVVGLMATVAWLATLVKMPQLRYLGLFVMMPVLLVMFLAGTLLHQGHQAGAGAAVLLAGDPRLRGRGRRGDPAHLGGDHRAVPDAVPVRAARRGRAIPARFAALGSRLPAAASLDKAAYRTVAFAFPIYTAGVIFGAIWAEAAWGRYWGWDPKETWAFIAWVVYATYLHARATAGWKGTGRPHQPAGLRRHDVQLLRGEHRDLRAALLRRPDLAAIGLGAADVAQELRIVVRAHRPAAPGRLGLATPRDRLSGSGPSEQHPGQRAELQEQQDHHHPRPTRHVAHPRGVAGQAVEDGPEPEQHADEEEEAAQFEEHDHQLRSFTA